MSPPHILVVGGGIAGLSAAAALATTARVTILEAEEQIGFHSSGRSATMVHYALGDRLVRALTHASRAFFDNPDDGFSEGPLGERRAVLVHARENEREELGRLHEEISRFANLDYLEGEDVLKLCPLLKDDARYAIADMNGLRLDAHALLQANLRQVRRSGSELRTGARIVAIEKKASSWLLTSDKGEEFAGDLVVNAAGSWADALARLAGLKTLGLEPKRRTIVTFDAPPGTDLDRLPFTKTIGDELYFGAESGRLFASPMDEVPSDPMDAQPDEFEVALAAFRMEDRTRVKVSQIRSKWAGLRTFAPDRHPVAGFAPNAEGFFWLAGQGGFGLQTSPAMAAVVSSLISGTPWPLADVSEAELSPARFLGQPA